MKRSYLRGKRGEVGGPKEFKKKKEKKVFGKSHL